VGNMKYFLGIDPGSVGALSIVDSNKTIFEVLRLQNATGAEVADWLRTQKQDCEGDALTAAIEHLQPMLKTSKVTMFKLGTSYGHLLGLLDALEIPYQMVRSQRWQKDMKCLSKGKKAITRAAAQRIWPKWKCTNHDSDSLLIALWLARFGQ
jgi:hypothetical protein